MTLLAGAVGAALGEPIRVDGPLGGGSICRVLGATTRSGRRIVVKSLAGAPSGMFAAERRGLEWLRVPDGPRIPPVLAVGTGEPPFIVLERIEPGDARARDDERVGQRIAALHRAGAPVFGLDHDNHLATLPQSNAPTRTWAEFLAERRLRPLARHAVEAGRMPPSLGRAVDLLADRAAELVGPPEAPARLHGDLWAGNLLVDATGEPVVIDPAAYGGHREVDLAMMRLFGGFGARVFAAYDEVFPPAPGRDERIALNQTIPLLVHVILFGGGYVADLAAAVGRYVPLR